MSSTSFSRAASSSSPVPSLLSHQISEPLSQAISMVSEVEPNYHSIISTLDKCRKVLGPDNSRLAYVLDQTITELGRFANPEKTIKKIEERRIEFLTLISIRQNEIEILRNEIRANEIKINYIIRLYEAFYDNDNDCYKKSYSQAWKIVPIHFMQDGLYSPPYLEHAHHSHTHQIHKLSMDEIRALPQFASSEAQLKKMSHENHLKNEKIGMLERTVHTFREQLRNLEDQNRLSMLPSEANSFLATCLSPFCIRPLSLVLSLNSIKMMNALSIRGCFAFTTRGGAAEKLSLESLRNQEVQVLANEVHFQPSILFSLAVMIADYAIEHGLQHPITKGIELSQYMFYPSNLPNCLGLTFRSRLGVITEEDLAVEDNGQLIPIHARSCFARQAFPVDTLIAQIQSL